MSQVSASLNFGVITLLTLIIRCTSQPRNLDVYSASRTQRYTENLVYLLDSQSLWTEYGIDDDIVVGLFLAYHLAPYVAVTNNTFPAIHIRLPTCRHSCDDLTGSIASANQGHVQGPSSNMGVQISPCETW